MKTLIFLVVFPLIPAFLLLITPFQRLRAYITRLSVAVIAAASVYAAYFYFRSPAQFYTVNELISHKINLIMFGIEALITLYIIYAGFRYKKYLASLLGAVSFGVMAYYEFTVGHTVQSQHALFIDQFSVIMTVIIGVIGGLICVYALGYMKDFHHHHTELKDKRRFFFFILFVFLSAMFGIVFSNNIVWLFFFWEITTLSSFLLIGYTKTPEAINNAFRAIIMNLLGGIAFAVGIYYIAKFNNTIDLDVIIAGKGKIAMIPIALFCFAGITKSAQMPFSSWLLGAMVAPTPTSALLHSSTMVKAGVYLVIRFSPMITGTQVGNMVALIGGLTFLIGAFIAVSQSNAKKVFAYSTVSNLGLIIACAGVGTPETMWAAVFLIIFHAVAKSLLFLSVGTIEHKLGSRDIEDMDNLITKMPALTMMVIVGICGMFVAPFGMLISKWAALKAFINIPSYMSVVLIVLIAYGSAVTVFFWTKWAGKLIAQNRRGVRDFPMQKSISGDEWSSELIHAILTIAVCFAFPLISHYFVEPYTTSVFGVAADMGSGNYTIMLIMIGMILVLPAIDFFFQSKLPHVAGAAYMAGRNESPDRVFDASFGKKQQLTLKNYYIEKYFGEKLHMTVGAIITTIVIVIMFGVSFL